MALPTYYSDGTISVANGATSVAGTGTAWANLIKAGDILRKSGYSVRVASVETNNGLTLTEPWPGTSLVAATYEIEITFVGTEFLLATRRILEQLATGAYAQPDASGTLAERAAFDAEAEGFIYWQTDVDPFLIFVKRSATSADWSAGVSIQGPTGATGPTGAGDRYDIAFFDPARPAAAEEVFKTIFSAASVTFAASLSGSRAQAAVAATAEAVFSVKLNGTEFGTFTFAAAGTVATFTGTLISVVAGDILTIVAPNPRDATLSGIFGTLAGSR